MAENALVDANTRFACKLFTELHNREPGANLFISPASVALALALAGNGAAGATWRAIAETLSLGAIELGALNRANAVLIDALHPHDPQVQLALANSLWLSHTLALDPEFQQRCQTIYNAQIANLDFASPQAVARINQWVKQQTNGAIDRIIEHVEPSALLFLINAIYFKGAWARPFEPRSTEQAPFTPLGGQPRPHPLMSQHGSFSYYETAEFQAASLPYGDGRVTMDIYLPSQRSSLPIFCQSLNSTHWSRWASHFAPTEGAIRLPRFKLAYEATLNDALKALGMGIAFSNNADFSGISSSEPNIRVDEVKHKTFIEVNEQGTEAAGVTSIGMMRASFMPKKTFRMIVDRPFFCAIRDTQTGTILFMGAIADPAA